MGFVYEVGSSRACIISDLQCLLPAFTERCICAYKMSSLVQVMAVHSAVVKGSKELCSVSQQEMLDLMEITDEIREHIGEHHYRQFLMVIH